jgi:8-oxo-dGTP pyrophosphatase MutT (NUDIX family)
VGTGAPAGHGEPWSPAREAVEVVDPDGFPVGVVSRAEMRATNARHRATYIVVRDARARVVVHQRAAWKDIWPSRWDLAFGGVCGPGEAWRDSAVRELAEEAGITVDPDTLVDLGPVRFESAETRVVGRVFLVDHDGPFTFPDGEVVDHDRIAAGDLAAWAARTPLCDDSATVVVPLVLGR